MDAVWQEAEPDSRLTPDGSLRIEQRLGSLQWRGETIHDRWVVITDAASGQIIVDCRRWPRSRAHLRPNGLVHLRLSLAIFGSDTLYVIDPARRVFRDLGLSGPERLLTEMQAAIDDWLPEFHNWVAGSGWEQRTRNISPDGTLRIDESIVEHERGPTMKSAQAFDTATGAKIFDPDEQETFSIFRKWDGENVGLIGVRRLGHFDMFDIALNAAKGTWRMGDAPEARIDEETRPEIRARLKAAEQASARRDRHGTGEVAERATRIAALIFGLLCGAALMALYDAAFGPVLGGLGL